MIEIFPIFAEADADLGGLYAVKLPGEDLNAFEHFERFAANGAEWLYEFVNDHWHDYFGPDTYYGFRSKLAVQEQVLAEAVYLIRQLNRLAVRPLRISDNLSSLFQRLNDDRPPIRGLENAEKAKDYILRLYGIRVRSNLYVMTGWCLKCGKAMQDFPEGQIQYDRLVIAHRLIKPVLPNYQDHFVCEPFQLPM